MKRLLLATLLAATPALAQDPAPVYQPDKQYSFELKGDGWLRQEWTESPITFIETDRLLARVRPRVEIGINKFLFGLGGDFGIGSDENTEFAPVMPLLRDNFQTKDARLDLAFARFSASAFRLDAGRFVMPVRLTEMIWDRELRPQGASAALQTRDRGAFKRLALTGLWASGSHVFPQEGAFDFSDRETLWLASGSALAGIGESATFELVASYLTWSDLDNIDRRLRRQNTRVSPGGPLAAGYDVVDLVVRFAREGKVPVQLVADVCRNTAVDDRNDGLWLTAVLGSTRTAPVSLEYTFAHVDPDATLAAFAADDFIWQTGWEGHRGDLGVRIHDHWSAHAIAQQQRFKDAPNPAERDVWLSRYRLELRADF